MKFTEKVLIPIIVIALITAVGCYYIMEEYNKKQVEIRKGITEEKEDFLNEDFLSDTELKSEGTAILIGKNIEEGTLMFSSLDVDKQMEIKYNGTTQILGKHGNNMSLAQIPLGEILDVTYSVSDGTVTKMQVSNTAWTQTGVRRFKISEKKRSMQIADDLYRMEPSVLVSYGDKLANLFDVTSVDTLVVKGIGREVYSIIVEEGHGYLRLNNDAYFLGGWIEVGQEVITRVSEGMLLPVPEGEYHLRVTNKGYAGDEDIVISRDKETIIDLSDVDITEVAIGHIKFDINPDYAQLYIDGEITEYEDRVPLEYGVHNVHVELAGYKSVDTNIKVKDEFADVTIELERSDEISDSSSSSSTDSIYGMTAGSASSTSSSMSSSRHDLTDFATTIPSYTTTSSPSPFAPSTTSTSSSSIYYTTTSSSSSMFSSSSTMTSSSSTSSSSSSSSSSTMTSSSMDSSTSNAPIVSENNQIFVEAPEGAQLYIDGVYVGVIPTALPKVTGSHIFILYRDGYPPKSYTEEIDDDGNDITISFPDIIGLFDLDEPDDDESTNEEDSIFDYGGDDSYDVFDYEEEEDDYEDDSDNSNFFYDFLNED